MPGNMERVITFETNGIISWSLDICMPAGTRSRRDAAAQSYPLLAVSCEVVCPEPQLSCSSDAVTAACSYLSPAAELSGEEGGKGQTSSVFTPGLWSHAKVGPLARTHPNQLVWAHCLCGALAGTHADQSAILELTAHAQHSQSEVERVGGYSLAPFLDLFLLAEYLLCLNSFSCKKITVFLLWNSIKRWNNF